MKVVLTENQINYLLSEEARLNAICGLLEEGKTIEGILARLRRMAALGATLSMLTTAVDRLPVSEEVKDFLEEKIESIFEESPEFRAKVEAVEEYMKPRSKGQTPGISAEKIVRETEKNKFDLALLLAQAQLESNFGTAGRSLETNSVFNVGAYDSGVNKCSYPTMDDSIPAYINLMQNDYLDGKTISDLLEPGGFVNYNKKRYASDPNYESKVKNQRNFIINYFNKKGIEI